MLPGKLAFVTGKCARVLHQLNKIKNKINVIYLKGAGGGIGRAICRIMAKEGATVVATDINLNNVQSTVADLTGRIIFLSMTQFIEHN